MKVLSIGNSFSGNAQRYLHRLAQHNGVNMRTVNLFIGGCSLQTHYWNMLDDRDDYSYVFNGEGTGLKVSIRQALRSDSWDVITLQQASPYSPNFATYTPYIEELAAYVRKYSPHAKIILHETWAYAEGSDRLINGMHFEKAEVGINGAYPMVCREFVRMLMAKYPQLKYINREDDMGIESLRRSKQSYKPEFMLKKYIARWIYG